VSRLEAGRGQVQVPAAGKHFCLLHNVHAAFCSESKNSSFGVDKVAEGRLVTQLHTVSTKQTKSQSKFHPVICREGTEREYNYRSTVPLTSMLDGNRWLMPRHGRFTPRIKTGYPLHMRLCDTWKGAEILRTVQPVDIPRKLSS